MKTLKFNTNIKCGGCLQQVSPKLNEVAGSGHWQVDLANPKKVLTVETDSSNEESIVSAVREAGFEAQAI